MSSMSSVSRVYEACVSSVTLRFEFVKNLGNVEHVCPVRVECAMSTVCRMCQVFQVCVECVKCVSSVLSVCRVC